MPSIFLPFFSVLSSVSLWIGLLMMDEKGIIISGV